MTSNVEHLFLTDEDKQESSSYERFEPSDSDVGNMQSGTQSADKADFGRVWTTVVPRPMYRLPPEPAPQSNKNFLSFFSLSF